MEWGAWELSHSSRRPEVKGSAQTASLQQPRHSLRSTKPTYESSPGIHAASEHPQAFLWIKMSAPSPLPSPSATPPPGGSQGVRFSDNSTCVLFLRFNRSQADETRRPSRSPHFVSRAEVIKGVSNRFVFSTFYIYLYLAMALLSYVALRGRGRRKLTRRWCAGWRRSCSACCPTAQQQCSTFWRLSSIRR